ncbi:hypothetical protein DPMN_034258 [Dreissena polymorpha]|uniref:Uncharacterized protein n=1 Tax=Dreissena polymorpha TaxID=45954 RepID=A0A9D4RJX4_DREPO|nr:hypothetical protein DPMN_034258 [Dreissena polymorpha]
MDVPRISYSQQPTTELTGGDPRPSFSPNDLNGHAIDGDDDDERLIQFSGFFYNGKSTLFFINNICLGLPNLP